MIESTDYARALFIKQQASQLARATITAALVAARPTKLDFPSHGLRAQHLMKVISGENKHYFPSIYIRATTELETMLFHILRRVKTSFFSIFAKHYLI